MRQPLSRMYHFFSSFESHRFRQELRQLSLHLDALAPERIAVRFLLTQERLTRVHSLSEWRFSAQHAVAKVLPIRGP